MAGPEKPVEAEFVFQVLIHGGIAPKFEVKGRRGYPDRIGLLPGGYVLFCEAKAPGEKPRPDQLSRIRTLRRLGFTVIVPDTTTKVVSEVRRFARRHGIRRLG